MFKAAANLFHSEKMAQVVDACTAVGLDVTGADWDGVKYWIDKFENMAGALATPDGRERARAAAAVYGYMPVVPADAAEESNRENCTHPKYCDAVMYVCKLMSGKKPMPRAKAI